MNEIGHREYKETPKSKTGLCNEQLFIDGPSDYLPRFIVDELKKVTQWAKLFIGGIDHYKKMDYSMRSLPALRIYTESYGKKFDSWFINGDVTLDVIFPASLRRHDLEDIPGQVANALLQQFRRPTFFSTLRGNIPGLNELGKEFNVDKALGFQIKDNIVPLTQIKANFRIDLREWDTYLTETFRTKDEPFKKVLGNLDAIAVTIQGVDDDLDTESPNTEDTMIINTTV